MNSKLLKLIQVLLEKTGWTTSVLLAVELGVSNRSIKNYIQEINSIEANTIESSRLGFKIDLVKGREFLKNHSEKSEKNRFNRIIFELINHLEGVDIETLSEKHFISHTTILNEIDSNKEWLSKFNITILQNKGILKILGAEIDIRRIVKEILTLELEGSIINLDSLIESFPQLDVRAIYKIIADNFTDLELRDFAVLNILLHILITLDRNLDSHEILSLGKISIIDEQLYLISETIYSEISRHENIIVNQDEINHLYLLLVSRTRVKGGDNVNVRNLTRFVSQETMTLMDELTEVLKHQYNLVASKPEFIVPFALHLENLEKRASSNMLIDSRFDLGIKLSHPFIFEIAVHLATIINEKWSIYLSGEEISYIALHIGGGIESLVKDSKKIKTLLVANINYSLQNQVISKLDDYLEIDIIGTNQLDYVDSNNYELILSNVKLDINKEYLQLSPIISVSEHQMVLSKIDEIQKNRKMNDLFTELESVTSSELFFHNLINKGKHDLLSKLTQTLVEKEIVDNDFYENVLIRENLVSTRYSSIAIPHTLKMNALKSALTIVVNPSGIPWDGDEKVYIVFLFAITERDRETFLNIFELISEVFLDQSFVLKAIKQKTYDDFMELIKVGA